MYVIIVSICININIHTDIYVDSYIILSHIITAMSKQYEAGWCFKLLDEQHWEQSRGRWRQHVVTWYNIDMQCWDYKQKCTLDGEVCGSSKDWLQRSFVGFELCNMLLNYLICESQKLFSNRKTSKIEWLDFLCYWSLLFYFNIKLFEV